MGKSQYDERGFEVPDSRPMQMPVGFQRPLSVQEMIRRFVRTEVSIRAAQEGHETFEEADDFEVGEEPELRSPYELDDEQMSGKPGDFVEEKPDEKPKKKKTDGPKDGPKPSTKPSGKKAPKEPEPEEVDDEDVDE